MSKYQGHKNWNHWNVCLWIGNDEGLYQEAKRCIRRAKNRQEAAEMMFNFLVECGIKETPDGAPYSVSAIRAAMVGM